MRLLDIADVQSGSSTGLSSNRTAYEWPCGSEKHRMTKSSRDRVTGKAARPPSGNPNIRTSDLPRAGHTGAMVICHGLCAVRDDETTKLRVMRNASFWSSRLHRNPPFLGNAGAMEVWGTFYLPAPSGLHRCMIADSCALEGVFWVLLAHSRDRGTVARQCQHGL